MHIRLADFFRILSPLAKLFALWLVAFQLCRLILVAATWPLRGDATAALLLEAFIIGLRFDLAVSAALTLPFALWMYFRRSLPPVERHLALLLFALTGFAVIFALIAEVEFYKEFQMRLGPLVFEYFGNAEHKQIVLSMIWEGYPVVRWMLAVAAIWLALLLLAKRVLHRNTGAADWRVRAAALTVWLLASVIAIRGGLTDTPLRWGDAYFSNSAYANHIAGNGAYLLFNAPQNRKQKNPEVAFWRDSFPAEAAYKIVRDMTLHSEEALIQPETYPLLRRSTPSPIAKKRPKNIVVVMMESFSARFTGAIGAGYGATPNFDALAREGILFDRAFSVGTHTAQGVPAVLCSFPNLPGYEALMKHPAGSQPMMTLPKVLGDQGFETVFLYNGLFSWDNMEEFFRAHGVQRFIQGDDYVNPSFVDPTWGVSDYDVFVRAVQEFSATAGSGRPFLGIVLTLSNHAPFNLPEVPGLERLKTGGDQNQRVNGVHYADWALGEFMRKARSERWFDETLFVFVGDHGFGIPPVLTEVNILHMHVPLLFYGPKIFGDRHEVRHTVASQLDIVPTVLGIVGSEALHQSFGRDLFLLDPADPGHAFVKQSGDSVLAVCRA
jgi:phosphoglycerol transferase MdoB-like AlkP superfamily enzyme